MYSDGFKNYYYDGFIYFENKPSHWLSPRSLIPLGHWHMKPRGRSTHWWEQPPFATAHSS